MERRRNWKHEESTEPYFVVDSFLLVDFYVRPFLDKAMMMAKVWAFRFDLYLEAHSGIIASPEQFQWICITSVI